jgi:hypothetical protein
MPPVLNIPLDELVAGCTKQVLAGDCSLGDRERHYVLKLVAETISAAELIERRASPNATGESLIKEPVV